MSHLPPKPDFDYPARYPTEPRHFSRPPPSTAYTSPPERYPPRDRHVYLSPRSPPRSRTAASADTYVPVRSAEPYRSTRPAPPPFDAYSSSYYSRRDDERHRDREHERRGDDSRLKGRNDYLRDKEAVRDRERRRDDDTRKGYDGERRDRDASRERQWSRQRDEDRERREREWARQRQEDRERQEREWARQRDEDRRYGRDRTHEVEPERKWVPRMSRSPPRRMVSGKLPEQSPAPSRARSPAPVSPARRAPATPLPAASRAGSPFYKVERSRPLRSRSPPYEVRLGNHSIAVPRNSARPRRDPSPRDNDRDRRQPSLRRSRSPDRSRRELRRDISRGSRVAPPSYRGRERRSPRRRSYTPVSPPRRKSPRPPPRRRTPSPPSRSRTRSPTRTPPQKRHVLPPLKSPSRPPPPPPPTGPRVRPVHQTSPRTDGDGDVEMQEPAEVVAEASAAPSTSPAEPSAVSPIPVPTSTSPCPHSAAPSPRSPELRTAPAISSLPSKPELETDKRALYPRRRSRSPPTGPRHHHYVSTPSNRSPAQNVQAGLNLPSKPDWVRRGAGREAGKQEATASVPAPAASASSSELGVFVPVIPPYQAKPSITIDIEADIARLRAHRMHVENEYVKIVKDTRKALNDLLVADIDLKNAESRRAVSSAQLEKARAGKLGIDFIAGS